MQNIELLKSLTQTTYDSVQGYTDAAQKADAGALKTALEQRRDKRSQTLSMMNRALIDNGGEAVTSTSASRKAHAAWTGLTDAISSGDKAVVERIEEGEDHLKSEFKDALDDDARTEPELRRVIEKAYTEIQEGERFTDMLEKKYA